jgi:hypothetical protein
MPHADVDALGDEVDRKLGRRDLDRHIGIALKERPEQRCDAEPSMPRRNAQADHAARGVMSFADG